MSCFLISHISGSSNLPQVCPSTGDLIYIGYNLVPTDNQPSVAVGVVSAKGEVVHKVTLPCARPSMQHDVAITRTRTVLMDGPLIFNLQKSIAGGRPFDFDCRCHAETLKY